MQRVPNIINGRLSVELRDVSDADDQQVRSALEAFRSSTNHAVGSTVDLLQRDYVARHLTAEAVERLSKWSNSDGSFASAVDPARKVAKHLLGLTPPRLVERNNRPVSDYQARVEGIVSRMGLVA